MPSETSNSSLPPGYARGVCFTTMQGLMTYRGRPVVMNGYFMPWEQFQTYSLRQILSAMDGRLLYHARRISYAKSR